MFKKANIRIADSAAEFLDVKVIPMWSGKFMPFSVKSYYKSLDSEEKALVDTVTIASVGGKTTTDYVIQVPYFPTVTTDSCAQNNAERVVSVRGRNGEVIEIVSPEKVEAYYESEKGFVPQGKWSKEIKWMYEFLGKEARGEATLEDVKEAIRVSAVLTGKVSPKKKKED